MVDRPARVLWLLAANHISTMRSLRDKYNPDGLLWGSLSGCVFGNETSRGHFGGQVDKISRAMRVCRVGGHQIRGIQQPYGAIADFNPQRNGFPWYFPVGKFYIDESVSFS